MKVAMLTDLPFWRTPTMYLDELEKRMPKFGIYPEIFTICNSKFFSKIDNSTGIFRTLNSARLLRTLVRFDVIHVQFTFPLGLVFTLFSSLRLLKKPIIIHTHGYDVFAVPSINYGLRRNSFGRLLAHNAWMKSDRIITVCKSAKLEIEKNKIKQDKIDVLYNGIDEKLFCKTNIPAELHEIRQDNDLIFLSVASAVPVKNQSRLVEAFEYIVKKYSPKFRIKLILIGSSDNSVMSKINDQNIVYLGKKKHSELRYFYNIADVFVLPSLSEAHPWSLLEAMSCELPVIASNVGGIPETINDPRLLVNPLDSKDISKKFEYLIEMNPDERKKIGSANRQRVLANYTLDKHIEDLKKIYEISLS